MSDTNGAPDGDARPPAGANDKARAGDAVKVTLRGPDGEIKGEVTAS